MNIPIQFILYILIILLYTIHKKRKGYSIDFILNHIGLSFSYAKYYYFAILVAFFSSLLAWILFILFPVDHSLLTQTSYKNYNISDISLFTVILVFFGELIFVSFGEELLFRGLIGGYLFKKFSFLVANLFQMLIFLLPHLLLLSISLKLFPFIITIMISAWFLGWLRFKSDSVLPCIITHTIVNTLSIIYFFSNI